MIEVLESKFELSSRKRRFAAFVIDHFVITFFLVAIIFLAIGPNFMNEGSIGKTGSIGMIVMLPGILLYFSKDSIKGISAGRWIMGIMVRDDSDPTQIPSFWRLLIRNLLLIIWPVEFIILAASKNKKRLGDSALNTVVIKNSNKHSKPFRILILLSIGICFFLFITLFTASAMKNSEAYKITVHNIELNEDILNETGGITGYGMIPTGNITITNGHGEAQLQITVKGIEKDVIVTAYLTKEPTSDWQLVEMN